MTEMSSVLALVAAVVLVLAAAVHGWLRRAEARREEVRRLAWHAAEEAEVAERADAYRYGQYGGFVVASDIAEAPLLWTAPPVAPPVEAPPPPPAPLATGKGVCAMCGRQTTFRCKRCKSIKYCTFRCQIAHWRQGHKDECHPPSVDARQHDKIENVMARVGPAIEGLESEREKSNKQIDGPDNLECYAHLPCKSDADEVPSGHSGACHLAHNSPKRADSLPDPSVRSEAAGLMPSILSTGNKNARQQTAPKVLRHYSPELTLFPYKQFVDLYNFEKVELHPFGLYNLGNSCYANAVLQCLTFTRPLTAYLLEGHHSQNCSKKEWCFMCELEKLIIEGKREKSPVSPTGILSHLHEIGHSFGQGREEDAHEFLRYAIDTMQSASMKEARKNGVLRLAEETTLMQLIFGGYLQSKIKCTNCQVSSEQFERILDLTVEIDGDIATLEDALRRFTSSEVLDGDNRYHCSRCKSYERAKKKLTISEAPNVLTIALKRYQSGKFGKINKVVRFKEHLNLSDYMSATDDYTPVYKLYAVVVHRDVMNATSSGHYVCYVKDPQGKWHEMDDSKVKPVSLEKVLSKCAYMLLYARCSPRAPSFVRKAMDTKGLSHAKNHKQLAYSRPTSSGGGSYLSRHQDGQLCQDHKVNELTPTLDTPDSSSHGAPDFGRSDSSSLFSSSDAASTSTLSSDSTDNTMSSSSMEYDYIFGSSDQMYPVSTAVIPEEEELSYSREWSSLNSSSSGQNMDQTVEFVQQNRSGKRVWEESGGDTSFSYTEQKQRSGVSGHGPREGRDGILHRKSIRERTAQAFY
ncbi:hypothetical protein QOZ80_6AG0538070 [Eleusine coracana subsp. coracana]|nr:hypothetical protein QOZ80_6AG0538070 [Eleusine coracana subsp. coracana]